MIEKKIINIDEDSLRYVIHKVLYEYEMEDQEDFPVVIAALSARDLTDILVDAIKWGDRV